jgi:dTMP kinase
MYFILEGIDTAGKSTQLDILKQKYPSAIFTKEPGGTPLGNKIRDIVLQGEASSKVSEMFLFLADRAQHSFEIIRQNPDEMIISDRGVISGIAYAKDIPMDIAITLNLIALNGAVPTKIVLLELTKEELEKRLSQKTNDAIEKRGSQYLIDVQERMKQAIKELNFDAKFIDARLSVSEIAKEIQDFLHTNSNTNPN